MALLSLLFKKQPRNLEIQAPKKTPGDFAGGNPQRMFLQVDAVDNVQHQHEAEVTENPIEGGAKISDHMDIKPKVLSFNGVVSEAPIRLEDAILGNVAGAVGGVVGKALGGVAGVAATAGVAALGGALLNSGSGNRVLDAMKSFEELQSKKIPVTIITGLRAYENMVLTSFVPTETASTGRSLSFAATFREIRVVRSKKGNKSKFDKLTGAIADAVSNVGTAVAAERGASILSNATGFGS